MNDMISFSEQCQKRVSEMAEVCGQETKGDVNKTRGPATDSGQSSTN